MSRAEPKTRMDVREARFRAKRAGIVRPADVDPASVMRVLPVPAELDGMRLDRFVQSRLRATSRARSQLIVACSAFDPDGHPLKKNHRVRAGERVVLWRPPWDEIAPDDAPVDVIHEDSSLLAINKPPLMAVHPTARFHKSTVTAALSRLRPDDHLSLVHRLDRETSGVLLLARTRAADRAVKLQLEARQSVVKRYLAIVWNDPDWQRHTSELPLEPDPVSRYRVKMRIARAGAGLPSATTFELLGRRRSDRGRSYSMIRCTLHTGRQHQIRVHLAALGLPVVGDKLYGPDEAIFARGADGLLTSADLELLELPRHALHAETLELDHPDDGRRLILEAPLYPDLAELWDGLGA